MKSTWEKEYSFKILFKKFYTILLSHVEEKDKLLRISLYRMGRKTLWNARNIPAVDYKTCHFIYYNGLFQLGRSLIWIYSLYGLLVLFVMFCLHPFYFQLLDVWCFFFFCCKTINLLCMLAKILCINYLKTYFVVSWINFHLRCQVLILFSSVSFLLIGFDIMAISFGSFMLNLKQYLA
jgi:hypothetical protein